MSELTGAKLERKRGDTAPDVITVIGNIVGFSYKLTLNTHRNPNIDILLGPLVGTELMQSQGVVNTDGETGTITFPWTEDDADQIPGKTYWYDVQQIDTVGKKKTIFKNECKFWMDITKQ